MNGKPFAREVPGSGNDEGGGVTRREFLERRGTALLVATAVVGVLLAAPVPGATQHVNDQPGSSLGGGATSVETPDTPDPRL